MLMLGMSFGAAFLTTFIVENALDEPIWITPVGAVGVDGIRRPLPVSYDFLLVIPTAKCGGYELQPQQTVAITYDMDDINFSEIVVESRSSVLGQLVVDANPTANRYHSPEKTEFVIHQGELVPVTDAVLNAARHARTPNYRGIILICMIVIPWPSVVLVSMLKMKSRVSVGTTPQCD
ncbi:MAG: hypothetical protein NT013_12550 [Planctomycetia bacterium]|nr:hypothetical protein [Planctomycetia bacterium]